MIKHPPYGFLFLRSYIVQAERGVINKGDEVEIIGYGDKLKTIVTSVGW